jgi:hypothetical protein
MRFAFWNTRKNSVNAYISSLIRDNQIDILVLAEYDDDSSELVDSVGFQEIPSPGCDRIKIYANGIRMDLGPQDAHYSIQIVEKDFILCCVHLSSKLFDPLGFERGYQLDKLLNDLEKLKAKNGISNVVFLGDLNENPYERNVLEANRLHALPCYYDLDNETREIKNKSYTKYYNPMWNLFGDKEGPPGTYFHSSSYPVEPFWHMLDQVIISKSLFCRFPIHELRIVTNTSSGPLAKDNYHPIQSISDHLPFIFEIGESDERFCI